MMPLRAGNGTRAITNQDPQDPLPISPGCNVK